MPSDSPPEGNEALKEYLDVVDENGMPTGETISREEAHRLILN
jgi:hypothetical protein